MYRRKWTCRVAHLIDAAFKRLERDKTTNNIGSTSLATMPQAEKHDFEC